MQKQATSFIPDRRKTSIFSQIHDFFSHEFASLLSQLGDSLMAQKDIFFFLVNVKIQS